jgi:hypothetical protein
MDIGTIGNIHKNTSKETKLNSIGVVALANSICCRLDSKDKRINE